MYLIGPLNLVNLGVRILLLNLTKCLKTAGIDATELKAPELKIGFRLADLSDDPFSLVFREIERVIDLNGFSLKIPAISVIEISDSALNSPAIFAAAVFLSTLSFCPNSLLSSGATVLNSSKRAVISPFFPRRRTRACSISCSVLQVRPAISAIRASILSLISNINFSAKVINFSILLPADIRWLSHNRCDIHP